ncbi:MAG: patatin-like phospholipase family protein [Chloroflexi bacterium]|nr:patatin-like phospholipase family protein [Chloroflexota bacterium]
MAGIADGEPVPARNRPALVLGGGGAFGLVQAAYVHAAYEAGFRPSLVVGTSVGSLNGAWVALHPDGTDELLRIWLGLDRLRVVNLNPLRLARRVLRQSLSICTNDIVPRLVREHLAGRAFADLKLPLGVVATNLSLGCKHIFRDGPLGNAILASTAIPGVFEPVEFDDALFVDGCLTAPVDMATALDMGATEILAIDLTPAHPGGRPKNALGVLRQSFAILTHATTDAMESCISQQLPVRVMRPDLSKSSPWRLDDSAGAIAHNLGLAHRALASALDADGHVIPTTSAGPIPPPEAMPVPALARDRFFHRQSKSESAA